MAMLAKIQAGYLATIPFFFFRITDPATKKYSLLIYGGEDIADVKEALPDAFRIRKINKHFMPKQNKGFSSSLASCNRTVQNDS